MLQRYAVRSLFLCLLVSLGFCSTAWAQGQVEDSTELRVLRQLYYATQGNQWRHQDGWLQGTATQDAAKWFGVQVQGDDVVGLDLSANLLAGALPASLGELTALQTLSLGENQLSSTIPTELSRLRQLHVLDLHANQLVDALPEDLQQLSKLQVLDIAHNHLEGDFPEFCTTFEQLLTLSLSDNKFSGPLSGNLGQLSKLRQLRVDHNGFEEAAGVDWASLTQLEELDLSACRFSEPLPANLQLLSQLRVVRLADNQFTGSLPAGWAALTSLVEVDLRRNQLTGPLPGSWNSFPSLHLLLLANNQLQGPLPASWSDLLQLTELNLSENRLTGFLSDSLARCRQLEVLTLAGNAFTGPLPAAWRSLTHLHTLDLSRNQVTGGLPASWQTLVALRELSVAQNRLTGPIPSSWTQFPQLQRLDLHGNRLGGTVPAAVAAWPIVRLVDLSANQFTGLPVWTGQAQVPPSLRVENNQMDFAALEPNFPTSGVPVVPGFSYGPQRAPAGADTVFAVYGSQFLTLTRPVGGSYNQYQWERKAGQAWVEIPGATTSAYRLTSVKEAQEGEYRTRVTNSWVPTLTLYSRPVYVSLLPYAPLPLNEPVAGGEPSLQDALAPPIRPAGETDAVNYVRTYTARAPFTTAAALVGAPPAGVQVQTQYVDGLGRPVQTVLHRESPAGRDVVHLAEYDALGRQPRTYLPYTADPTMADAVGYHPRARQQQYGFYRGTDPAFSSLTSTLPKTGVAFAETAFEPSPLQRPLAQGAAGESWMLSSGHVVALEERPSTAQDSVQRWQPGYGSSNHEDLVVQGAYAPGELWVKQTQDEHGNYVQEFTDKQGHVVLKQVELTRRRLANKSTQIDWLKTYYIYDDFGLLRAVLPPKAVQRLRKNGQLAGSPGPAWAVEGAEVERLLFRYRYDAKGRLIEKKVPDQDGYQTIVYDQLDRPVLTQDVAQRGRHEWSYTKYDALGRVVLTGLIVRNASAATLQAEADAWAGQWEERSTQSTSYYYTLNNAYPNVQDIRFSQAQALTVTYYDSYDFTGDGVADAQYQAPTAAELACTPIEVPVADARVTGQATRTRVRVLGRAETASDAWLTTTTFYDEKLRPIQLQSTNARGGSDVVSTRYDFTGKAIASYTVHQVPGQPLTRRVREQSRYDHAGRLLTVTQELEGATPQVLARHIYNELGQLERKDLGGNLLATTGGAVTPPLPSQVGPTALQTVDYRYNIRGWLTGINDVENPNSQDLWNFALSYDYGFTTNQFNGNIAGQRWRSLSDGVERAYGYRYDNFNRLLQGDFVARTGPGATAGWGAERGNYRFWAASYDVGGNLLTLRRRGLVQAATRAVAAQYAETDNLRYRYEPTGSEPVSNRLQRVDDLAPAATSFGAKLPERPDFSDGTTSGSPSPDYTYDAAGSLTSDRNKGITRIVYNHLHLPERIEWQNGNVLQYVYAAMGQKVAKLATEAGKPTVRTDYLGAWQYERDSLRWLNHAEGRALLLYRLNPAGGIDTKIQYEYTLKDHLGNLRVAFHSGERHIYRALLNSDPTQLQRDQQQFDSASVSYPIRRAVGIQMAYDGDGVAQLNAGGATPTPLGPLKQLAVAKNDTVVFTAYGMFQQRVSNSNWGFSLAGFVASLQQQPATQPPTTGENGPRKVRVLPLLSAGLTAASLPALQQLSNGVPKAYARVLIFNADSALVDSRTVQLTQAAEGGYQQLELRVLVPQAGYVQAYVANESDTDVFFDNVSLEHRQGLQVQENQYDPYGLDLAGLSRSAPPENKFTFNGKEKQTEFDLGWSDYGWRMYDPAICRWSAIDPMSDLSREYSSYIYGKNNPLRYIDPTGMFDVNINGPQSKQATEELQKTTNLILTRNEKTGALTATGNAKTDIDNALLTAINDHSIQVNVNTTNSSTTPVDGQTGRIWGGAYKGSSIQKGSDPIQGVNGPVEGTLSNVVVTDQAVNMNQLQSISKVGAITAGEGVLHELVESYLGAIYAPGDQVKIQNGIGVSKGYSQAHIGAAALTPALDNLVKTKDPVTKQYGALNKQTGATVVVE